MKTKLFLTLMLLLATLVFTVIISAADYTMWNLPEDAKIRLGKGRIERMEYAPDGTRLIVASGIGTWFYDAQTGEELSLLRRHTNQVSSVALSPDGNTLAIGSRDGTVLLQDTRTGDLLHTLTGHKEVWFMVFSPDSRTLASTSGIYEPDPICLWDVRTGSLLHTLTEHTGLSWNVAFSPDSTTIASGSLDRTVRVWNVRTGNLLNTFIGHTRSVNSVAFSPDGTTIASGSSDKTVRLWDVNTGNTRNTLAGHKGSVWDVVFSPDGTTIASRSSDKTVHLWDGHTGNIRNILTEHMAEINRMSFSPDSTKILTGSRDYTTNVWINRVWDVRTGDLVNTVNIILTEHTYKVTRMAFSPDGSTLASGNRNGEINLWNFRTGNLLKILAGHGREVWGVAFSPDGSTLASGSWDRTVHLWDVNTGNTFHTVKHEYAVLDISFSPDGRTLASGSWDNTVRLWDVRTGTLRNTLTGHTDPVISVAFSSDGRTLASGSDDSTVRLWDVNTGSTRKTLTAHTRGVQGVSFSPDGRIIASGGYDNTVRLWDVHTGELRHTLTGHTEAVTSVSFSSDGRTLASGSDDSTVHLWDVNTGSLLNTFTGHTDWVESVAFSPDGSTIASGSADGTILLWKFTPATLESGRTAFDVNGDGSVNIQDLVLVAASLGQTGENAADVNGDRVVNILDVTSVARMIGVETRSVNIPDPSLRAAIEEALGKTKGATITSADMLKLTKLEAEERDIQNLTSLEFATNLEHLYLDNNQIIDISVLSGLTNLRGLWLQSNPIINISALSDLTNLRGLYLSNNRIVDISALSDLTNLEWAYLGYNQISDASSLSSLTNLAGLNLDNNRIVDISVLSDLTNLERLYLDNNQIVDISVLSDLTNLKRLALSNNQISGISVLSGLTDLTWLSLGDNQISDVSPLSGLTSLEWLYLSNNQIVDISVLSDLTNLTKLYLDANEISDFSPIAGLIPNLEVYENSNQRVEEVPVTIPDGNTNALAQKVYNNHNQTFERKDVQEVLPDTLRRLRSSDIQPLLTPATIPLLADQPDILKQFVPDIDDRFINLLKNDAQINSLMRDADFQELLQQPAALDALAALIANDEIPTAEIPSGDAAIVSIDLPQTAPPVASQLTIHLRITNAQNVVGYQATVNFDPSALRYVSSAYADYPSADAYFGPPKASEGKILMFASGAEVGAVSGTLATVTFEVVVSKKPTIWLTDVLLSAPGGDPLAVTIKDSKGERHITVDDDSAGTAEEPVDDGRTHQPEIDPAGPINIPDSNLCAAIEEALSKTQGATITAAEMETLTELDASGRDIQDITELEYAINLTRLDLDDNQILDISPLANLKNLTRLSLFKNQILDLSPLAGLTSLEKLYLFDNAISDLSPLSDLINLTRLSLSDNAISDLSPLSDLINLTVLALPNNQISDLSALANLKNLTDLGLANFAVSDLSPKVSDLSPLANLKSLQRLSLYGNEVSDLSPLADLKNLEILQLANNTVSDVSPLTNLINLTWLELHSNAISDLSPLANLKNLTWLELQHNEISDILPLANLKNLENLQLGYNAISDLSPLANLKNLTRLGLQHNEISDFSPLDELIPNLESYSISGQHLLGLFFSIADFNIVDSSSEIFQDTQDTWELYRSMASSMETKKIDITIDGVPVQSRGSGSQQTFFYWFSPLENPTRKKLVIKSVPFVDMVFSSGSENDFGSATFEPNRVRTDKNGQAVTYITFGGEKKNISINIELLKLNAVLCVVQLTPDPFSPALIGTKVGTRHIGDVEIYADGKLAPNSLVGKYVNPLFINLGKKYNSFITSFAAILPQNAEAYFQFKVHEDSSQGNLSRGALYTINTKQTADIKLERDYATSTQTEGLINIGMNTGAKSGVSVVKLNPLTHAQLKGTVRVAARDEDVGFDNFFYEDNNLTPINIASQQEFKHRYAWNVKKEDTWLGVEVDGMRVEIEIRTGRILSTGVEIGAFVKLYEGDSADTNDLEDVACYTFISPWVPRLDDLGKPEQLGEFEDYIELGGEGRLVNPTRLPSIRLLNSFLSETEKQSVTAPLRYYHRSYFEQIAKLIGIDPGWVNRITPDRFGGDEAIVVFDLRPTPINWTPVFGAPAAVTTNLVSFSDVNSDGQVNVADLVLVSNYIGQTAPMNPPVDVNGDGAVTIADLVQVAQYLGQSTTSFAPARVVVPAGLKYATVEGWIHQARLEDDGSLVFNHGIAKLEYLLTLIIPQETALLHNYPNPFNPETWIPYHLAEPADVTLTIYAVDGKVVRRLDLGHQAAGYYQSKSRAAHWDGRNAVGECVASGIYFYTLTTGDFAATRKMLIMK